MQQLPFPLHNDLEQRIAGDPAFLAGLKYGVPRRGHPEGAVKWHVAEVLRNVEQWYVRSELYQPLRLIALIHDTFKYQVDPSKPRSGPNHHGAHARRFAEKYIGDEPTLEVIELHDEAYNAWQKGNRDGDWRRAEKRARALIDRLGETLALYRAFYRCDNATGDKQQHSVQWFEDLVAAGL